MITLIANPSSRSGRGKRLWTSWLSELEDAGGPFDLQESASREEYEHLAEVAAEAGHIVTAVGGDGSINAAVCGMMRASKQKQAPGAADARLGVLYAGTSPDFCRFHAIPVGPRHAMATLLRGTTRQIDIAALTFRSAESGSERHGYFASSCNIGLGAATARRANACRRYLGDTLGTCLGLVRAMLTHRPFACRLLLDGDPALEFSHVNHVILLKNPFIASGLRLQLPLAPDDGALYAVVIHGYSRLRLLGLLRSLYRGDWADLPGVFVRRCMSAAVETLPVQEVEYDGDPQGLTPASMTLLPRALTVLCDTAQGDDHA